MPDCAFKPGREREGETGDGITTLAADGLAHMAQIWLLDLVHHGGCQHEGVREKEKRDRLIEDYHQCLEIHRSLSTTRRDFVTLLQEQVAGSLL